MNEFEPPSSPAPSLPTQLASENRLAWLALTLTPGVGPKRILKAAQTLQNVSRLFCLSLTELESLNFPAPSAQFLFSGKARIDAEQELERVHQQGAAILTYEDADYPDRLREIFDPPPVLWALGDVRLLSRPSIAVVGTRHPTPYGTGMAEVLARDLASHRLVILSGMARGIDSAAHRGALAVSGGSTVAVWGTGVDVIYPKENKTLAENILVAGGAIISEYRLGTFPAPQNFPKRNRILSGMSIGVLVVEAGENSGTRVTARCALEQDRDVYAVPGNVTNKNAWGPNTLIKQGAKLVATWEDVWEELPTEVRLQLEGELGFASPAEQAASIVEELPLQEPEKVVLSALRHDEAVQLDELMEKLESKLTSSEIFTALFELELASRIKQLPGKNYVRRM
jgi:DNA processing protein